MRTNFNRQNIPFTMVANDVLSDPKLSWKAKGLYSYLYSKPESWNFSVYRIVSETGDGKDATLSAIHELEDYGLLKRLKHDNGRTTYWVTYPPNNFEPSTENPHMDTEKPSTENPYVGKSLVGKIRTISKKEGTKKKRQIQSKKELAERDSAGGKSAENIQIDEIIKAFSEFNPACSKMYGIPPQRDAVKNLISSQTFDRVMKIVALLPKTNQMTYAPNISTPHELWMKWSKLEDFLKKERQKQIDAKNKMNPQVNIINGIPVKVSL